MPKSKEVDAWFAKYDNPQKPVVQRVREILLAADPRITECIKWQSPTFVYGTNLASFNPRSKKHASLMFHTGAKIPGKHPRLQGGGGTSRYMNFADLKEANAAKGDLIAVVRAWIALQDGAPGGGAKKKAASKKKASKKSAKKKVASKKKAPSKRAAKKSPAKKTHSKRVVKKSPAKKVKKKAAPKKKAGAKKRSKKR